jgi:hypothetical protein
MRLTEACFSTPSPGPIGLGLFVCQTFPPVSGDFPRSCSHFPRCFDVFPRAPDAFPRTIYRFPRPIIVFPWTNYQFPRAFCGFPRANIHFPRCFGAFPRSFFAFPRAIGGLLRPIIGFPGRFSRSPAIFGPANDNQAIPPQHLRGFRPFFYVPWSKFDIPSGNPKNQGDLAKSRCKINFIPQTTPARIAWRRRAASRPAARRGR